jgi:hypothetical protein
MREATPELQLRTLFVLDERGRIVATREPEPARNPGPLFMLIRGTSSCAWAVRTDVPARFAAELDLLARDESPLASAHDDPVYGQRYLSLCQGQIESGPAFIFPEEIAQPDDPGIVNEVTLLQRNFRGWVPGEISERSPIYAVIESGYPVSVCFCARNTESAAEAGVETAQAFRGRGFAPRVTAAWALAIKASGRIPLYSTSWTQPGIARGRSQVGAGSIRQ